MAIITSNARLAELQIAGTENNPFLLFRNQLVRDNIQTNTLTGGFPASNLLTGTTYDFVQTSFSGAGTATFAFRPFSAVQAIALAGHNFHQIPGVQVTLRRSGGSGPTDTHTMRITPRGEPIVFRDTGSGSSQLHEIILGAPAASRRLLPRVAVLFAGEEVTLPQRLYQGYSPPFTPNAVDLQSNVSEGSQLLGSRVIRRGARATAQIDHLPQSFIRSLTWRMFQRHYNDGRGFFWCWRPARHPSDVHYAWREGPELLPNNTGPANLAGISLAMRFHESEDNFV